MAKLFDPLTLPCGAQVPNRIAKAAMEENMADPGQLPGKELERLYAAWAKGGAGLIITGNVMVAPDAMTGPGGVYLGKDTLNAPDNRARFERWSSAAKSGGAKVVMQISHPGRQVYASMGTDVVSASDTKVTLPGLEKMFPPARALTADEITALIDRFTDTAIAAQSAGFDGIEIHAAHGYLVSQFLSPLTNLRGDEWGGSLKNRARFLISIVSSIRKAVAPEFIVAVKLNSADFQKGGFDANDALQVAQWLEPLGVDFIELSGGSYESAAMMGQSSDKDMSSTLRRELYFFDFAKQITAGLFVPVMVTGGVTQKATAEMALADAGVDMIGIARALASNPDLPNDWKSDQNLKINLPQVGWKNRGLAGLAKMAMAKAQLSAMANGRTPKPQPSALFSLIKGQMRTKRLTKRYLKWLQTL